MKTIRLATIAALSATILAGGPVSALANESRSTETDNTVTFTANDEDKIVVEPPVDEPEVDPIDPTPPGQTGPLTLAYVSPMFDFGQQVISTQDQAYSMIAEKQTSGGEPVPYVSFAQVIDTRGTHEGWTLSVDLTDFKSEESEHTLTGARIEFSSPEIVYTGDNEDRTPSAATNEGNSLFLNVGQDDVVVMSANEGQGAGRSSIVWGDQLDLNEQAKGEEDENETEEGEENEEKQPVLNHGIRLHVPGSTTQDAAQYNATMTWSLSSVVDGDGETTPDA